LKVTKDTGTRLLVVALSVVATPIYKRPSNLPIGHTLRDYQRFSFDRFIQVGGVLDAV